MIEMEFEIKVHDGLDAFGAYLRPSAKNGEAKIFIDGKAIFKDGELLVDGKEFNLCNDIKKEILIETLMHEFGHALEDFFDKEFGEEFIENCVQKYKQINK